MLFNKKSSYLFLIFILVLVQLITNVDAKKKVQLTPEQQALKAQKKAERQKKSEEADKQIVHITVDEFKQTVMTDTENLWIVFYGSKKCPFTQKFNPKWLELQKKVLKKEIGDIENIKIAKMECYGNNFNFCLSQNNEFWPELMLYYKGVKKEVYNGEDEVDDILRYIVKQKKKIIDEGDKKMTKQIPSRPTKALPPKRTPSPKTPPKTITTKATKVPPTNYKENGNEMYDGENPDDEEEEEDTIINDGTVHKSPLVPETKTSSSILPLSIGGVVLGAFALICYRTKKNRGGYSHVNTYPKSPMSYKYNKQDKFIV